MSAAWPESDADLRCVGQAVVNIKLLLAIPSGYSLAISCSSQVRPISVERRKNTSEERE